MKHLSHLKSLLKATRIKLYKDLKLAAFLSAGTILVKQSTLDCKLICYFEIPCTPPAEKGYVNCLEIGDTPKDAIFLGLLSVIVIDSYFLIDVSS